MEMKDKSQMNSLQRGLILAGCVALIGTAAGTTQAEILLIAGNQGVVHQLDTDTGVVTFRGVCSGPVSSMIVNDGTLFLGDQNGVVYTFDVDTDQVTDAFIVPADASAMSWIADELVVADSGGELYYINPVTHAVVDSVIVTDTDITAMGIDAGGVFVGGQSSLAVRAHIGQDDFSFFAACGSLINSMAFGSDSMFLGGIGFGGSTTGTVYLFNKFAGGVEYTGAFDIESDATAMVSTGQNLYIAGSDGLVHEMDTSTGAVLRVFDTGIHIDAMTPQAGLVSCPADYDASGNLDFLDISRFIELFTTQLVPADTNGDGEFDFLDIRSFIMNYSGGC